VADRRGVVRAEAQATRRARRLAAGLLAAAGLLDVLSALTPPLRAHLRVVLEVVPLGVTQAAGALVALGGIGLLLLARGVRRGQRRAWATAVGLLAFTLLAHLAHGGLLVASAADLASLVALVAWRRHFEAPADLPSLRSAVLALLSGPLVVVGLATAGVEISVHLDRDGGPPGPSLAHVAAAVASRLVGLDALSLPERANRFLSPSLLAIGVALAVAVAVLATRPLVERRLATAADAEARARRVVARHGGGTLDYFALRDDKRWFFAGESMVAYGLYGGVCLVSPDPIGPPHEREEVWGAFRRYADARGWAVAVMAASEEWLPVYRAAGMRDIYIGDEAVVDVQRFSLEGGHMKGLRQAYHRVRRYGYRASFHDPATVDDDLKRGIHALLERSRRGELERGFSMGLGRMFDPRDEGLLLCVVHAPDGTPVACCHFVPAPGIDGYSLDVMRRDTGRHPNGLIDFALVSTIHYLRDHGCSHLSLNFAAMRSIIEGERGDGAMQRVQRWAVKRMSGFLQIESLYRFNAKYQPEWLARYVVFDAPEHLVPAVFAILRAESLWEVPVIGRVMAASDRRRALQARHQVDEAAAGR
jgi:lysylphosphatidylglycerol synthetase-like protein (DUF2156 family)